MLLAVHASEVRDQGLTRPKVLFLVPFRHSALRIVQLCARLLSAGDGTKPVRFEFSCRIPCYVLVRTYLRLVSIHILFYYVQSLLTNKRRFFADFGLDEEEQKKGRKPGVYK